MNCICQMCGYEWYPLWENPSRCPSCHTRKWNKNPFTGIPDKHLIHELESRGYNVSAKVGISDFALVLPNGNIPEVSKPLTLLEQALIYQAKLMQEFSEWLQSNFKYLLENPEKSYPVESKFKDLFWIIDTDKGINYVDQDLNLISKKGTKLIPVKHFAIVIFNEGDIKFFYKFCKQKDSIYIEPKKHCPNTSRPGITLFEINGFKVLLDAYESEYCREGSIYSREHNRYETRKGWVEGKPYDFNGYLEIRKPGELKGYFVLEELDRLPFGNIPETSEPELREFKEKHIAFIDYLELEEHHLKYKCSNEPPAIIPEGIPTDEKCSRAGCNNYKEDPISPEKYYCYYNCLDFGEFNKCPFKNKEA